MLLIDYYQSKWFSWYRDHNSSDENSNSESQFTLVCRGGLFNWDSTGTSNQSGLLHNAYYSTSNEFRKRTSTTGTGAGILRIINSGANKGYLEFQSGITTSVLA